tara:strand:- start:345 stop:1523 length:1179 start_codon:yes stop_codon:yes gene_type:complete
MSLIMPKGDGRLVSCLKSLSVYMDNVSTPLTNDDFKRKVSNIFRYSTKKDSSFLLKKNEVARYFGLVKHSFAKKESSITVEGMNFYNHPWQRVQIIMEALKEKTFGHNNCASKTSNSYLNPPNLYLRCLGFLWEFYGRGLTVKEFAYILYQIENNKVSFEDSINLLIDAKDLSIPQGFKNKYHDLKFRTFFKELNIIYSDGNRDFLNPTGNGNPFSVSPKDISKLKIFSYPYETEWQRVPGKPFSTKTISINNNKIISKSNNRKPTIKYNTISTRYTTDKKLKIKVFQDNNFKCEIDRDHKTFINNNEEVYMEGHHLIPMKAQKDFPTINIDRTENIVCICPTCHRMAHHGNRTTREKVLKLLYSERKKRLLEAGINISFQDLLNKYYNGGT